MENQRTIVDKDQNKDLEAELKAKIKPQDAATQMSEAGGSLEDVKVAETEAEMKARLKEEIIKEMSAERTAKLGGESQQRVMAGTERAMHDLYKLTVAPMLKNTSYTIHAKTTPIEHCHVFHTFDSNGRPLKTSSAIGGHFHPIEIVEGEEGDVPKLMIGPAMTKYRGKNVPVRFQNGPKDEFGHIPYITDTHSHDSIYIRSEFAEVRKMNADAAIAHSLSLPANLESGRL